MRETVPFVAGGRTGLFGSFAAYLLYGGRLRARVGRRIRCDRNESSSFSNLKGNLLATLSAMGSAAMFSVQVRNLDAPELLLEIS